MTGFSVPAVPFARRPAAASSPPQLLSATPTAAQAQATKKRKRNIACVTCNKQKKRCGLVRPCTRCIELKIPCTQPLKPEGFSYFTKRQKPNNEPPVFPGNLWAAARSEKHEHQTRYLPSPSPTISTVGTPQPSHTSLSSYGDSASTQSPTGRGSDAPQPGCSDSHIRLHSASPDRTFILTPTEEHPSRAPSGWNMPRWDLPPPPGELSDAIVKDSKYAGTPIFGLEKPIYSPDPQVDLAIFGEPMDLEDGFGGGVNDSDIQRVDDVDAGVATSGVASDAGGIAWNLDWLGEVDLLNTDLILDDVDLSGFDSSGLDRNILMDLGPHFFA